MKIGLIDADLLDNGTKFPNLALMKLSGYLKEKNDVKLIGYDDIGNYEKVYISKVFTKTNIPEIANPIKRKNTLNFFQDTEIILGGTGINYDKQDFLDTKIEHHYPDYNLYNNIIDKKIKKEGRSKYKYYKDYSIGFTTRFCFRQCEFCVNRNKTKVEKWSKVEEFYNKNKKYITLLDDNIMGSKDFDEIINSLIKLNKPFEYKQGLDIRLMTPKRFELFNKAKYKGDYIFAFDHIKDRDTIIKKIKMILNIKSNVRMKFYVLTGFKNQNNKNILDTFERIRILMKYGALSYVMRHKNIKGTKWEMLYNNIASWCNQPKIFKNYNFENYCHTKYGNKSKVVKQLNDFKKENPEVEKYLKLTYNDYKIIK